MPKHHNKLTVCPNCDTPLGHDDNFCPNCGQENHEVKLPLGHIIYEFVESITHFDNKLWNSLKAIFTRPGKMTAEFLEGKRMRYVPPARLYVFVSVIFFFLIGKFADYQLEKGMEEFKANLTNAPGFKEMNLQRLINNDSLLRSQNLYELANNIDIRSSGTDAGLAQTVRRLRQLKPAALDSLLISAAIGLADSNRTNLRKLIALIPANPRPDLSLHINMLGKKFSSEDAQLAYEAELPTMSDSKIDSLIRADNETPGWFTRRVYRQQGKFHHLFKGENTHELLHAVTKNLSVVMFILMPFVGILLLLFYFRRGRFYYEHLIFSVHIHTVIFLLFSLALLITYPVSPAVTSHILYWTFWICWIYFLLSLKRVYGQSWPKTVLKFLLFSLMYSIILALFIGGATFMGFLTF